MHGTLLPAATTLNICRPRGFFGAFTRDHCVRVLRAGLGVTSVTSVTSVPSVTSVTSVTAYLRESFTCSPSILTLTCSPSNPLQASVNGGGIFIISGSSSLEQVSMRYCHANIGGGGLYISQGAVVASSVALDNNTVAFGQGGAALFLGAVATLDSLLLTVKHNCVQSFGGISAVGAQDGFLASSFAHRGLFITFSDCDASTGTAADFVGPAAVVTQTCSTQAVCAVAAECVDAPVTTLGIQATPTTLQCICPPPSFGTRTATELERQRSPYVDGCFTPRRPTAFEDTSDVFQIAIHKDPRQEPLALRNLTLRLAGSYYTGGTWRFDSPNTTWARPLQFEGSVPASNEPQALKVPAQVNATGLAEGLYTTLLTLHVTMNCDETFKCTGTSTYNMPVVILVSATVIPEFTTFLPLPAADPASDEEARYAALRGSHFRFQARDLDRLPVNHAIPRVATGTTLPDPRQFHARVLVVNTGVVYTEADLTPTGTKKIRVTYSSAGAYTVTMLPSDIGLHTLSVGITEAASADDIHQPFVPLSSLNVSIGCQPGFVQLDEVRCGCSAGLFLVGDPWVISSASTCSFCDAGKYSPIGATSCQECGAVHSLSARSADTAEDFGPEIPRGIDCTGGVLSGTLAGHWSESPLTPDDAAITMTWSCLEESFNENTTARCLGGLNNSCLPGHDESFAMCARCLPQWYMSDDGFCVYAGKDPDVGLAWFLAACFMVGVFLLAVVATLLLWHFTPIPPPLDVEPPWEILHALYKMQGVPSTAGAVTPALTLAATSARRLAGDAIATARAAEHTAAEVVHASAAPELEAAAHATTDSTTAGSEQRGTTGSAAGAVPGEVSATDSKQTARHANPWAQARGFRAVATVHAELAGAPCIPLTPARLRLAGAGRLVHAQVFRELWMRGHFVTAGQTFGADYLCYPGAATLLPCLLSASCV